MQNSSSYFTISIDFELFWGVRDTNFAESYKKNILGGRKAIPIILNLFKKKEIHSTWAIVAMASFSNKKDLIKYLPSNSPGYLNKILDPYPGIEFIGKNEKEDPLHFGSSLVKNMIDTPHTEIASHSFSHFYCMEKRTNENAFKEDLISAANSFNRMDLSPKSYIFCRNQYEEKDLKELHKAGFETFRSNESSNIFSPMPGYFKRGFKLLDSYINLSGPNFSVPSFKNKLVSIPSSRFLRPYSNNKLERLRLKRILDNMTLAAKNKKGFHLWWHPHNFGENLQININFLEVIIDHFQFLKNKYSMESLTMSEVAKTIKN